MQPSKLAEIALKAGELLLKSGAEIYRVEDTIVRIFKAYGHQCECFVLLTGIFITDKDDENKSFSVLKRIRGQGFDLNRIEMVNAFSRALYNKKLSYNEAINALDEIKMQNGYSFNTHLMASGFNAFVYTLLFEGTSLEALIALLISIFVFIVKMKITEIGFFDFINFIIAGIVVAGASLIALKIFPALNIYKVIIGGVIILLPGMSITNGIKDALYGDVVSSLYRLAEVAFTVIGIGIGVGLILSAAL